MSDARDGWWTPLRLEIHALSVEHGRLIDDALKKCRSDYERSQCIQAYARVFRCKMDAISQRHGMQPMLTRAMGR